MMQTKAVSSIRALRRCSFWYRSIGGVSRRMYVDAIHVFVVFVVAYSTGTVATRGWLLILRRLFALSCLFALLRLLALLWLLALNRLLLLLLGRRHVHKVCSSYRGKRATHVIANAAEGTVWSSNLREILKECAILVIDIGTLTITVN